MSKRNNKSKSEDVVDIQLRELLNNVNDLVKKIAAALNECNKGMDVDMHVGHSLAAFLHLKDKNPEGLDF